MEIRFKYFPFLGETFFGEKKTVWSVEGPLEEIEQSGVLNGDCKSHWLTNEEIKDGKRIERETVDFFDLVARHFHRPIPFPVCVSTAKFPSFFFLTTLLIKATPSNPLDEKNRKRKFKTPPKNKKRKFQKEKGADQLQHLHPLYYTHLISVLGRLSHNPHFVVKRTISKPIGSPRIFFCFISFFFTTEIRPSERLKRQCSRTIAAVTPLCIPDD